MRYRLHGGEPIVLLTQFWNRYRTVDENNLHEEELQFHYNRSDRLSRAPEIVRSHYDGTEKQPPKGFFKSLVHTKSSRFLLGSIVLLIIMILFVTNVEMDKNSGTIKNVPFEITAFSFDSNVYVTITASESDTPSDLLISAYLKGYNDQDEEITHATLHSVYDGSERILRHSFLISEITQYMECIITLGGETLELRTKVQE